jgi:hypothetical protein
MAVNPLNKKLLIKAGHTVGIFNRPSGYEKFIDPLPVGAMQGSGPGPFDCVLCFTGSKAEVDILAPFAMKAVKPGGALWLCYPKGTSGVKTDINRDTGWDVLKKAGWEVVAQVAIDEKWTGSRFRPSGEVKTTKRKTK